MSDDERLVVVDDDDAVRESLTSILDAKGYKVEAFESGDDLLSSERAKRITCLLLDIQMPGTSGMDVLRELAARKRMPPTIVLTGHGSISLAVEAMKIGARDFLEKPFTADALLSAVSAASEVARPDLGKAKAEVDSLAPREVDVLRGLMRGQPNKIIAYELELSVRTVEHYRARLMAKLGVRSLSELVRIGIDAGL